MFYLKVFGVIVLAAAAAIGSVDLTPKSKLRLKDLDAPPEEWAAHADIWNLMWGIVPEQKSMVDS